MQLQAAIIRWQLCSHKNAELGTVLVINFARNGGVDIRNSLVYDQGKSNKICSYGNYICVEIICRVKILSAVPLDCRFSLSDITVWKLVYETSVLSCHQKRAMKINNIRENIKCWGGMRLYFS